MIQILTYKGTEKQYEGTDVIINKIHDAKSLDDFDINIISLNDENMWENKGSTPGAINSIADIKSLASMVKNSKKTEIVILYPQNLMHCYNYYSRQKYYAKKAELKDLLNETVTYVIENLFRELAGIDLYYENTKTKIEDFDLEASFCFEKTGGALLSSTSGKTVAIRYDKVIATTLDLQHYEHIMAFLRVVGLRKEKEEIPEWMKGVHMFNDLEQLDTIQECEQLIAQQKEKIAEAKKILDQNKRFKSILYTNGSELVDVVFDILKQMLGCNLDKFEDKKIEDFRFELNGITYIGEIKGISGNVSSTNITQLELHHSNFVDGNPDISEENIRCILIINYQRKRPIDERDPIDQRQIALAEKYGSLIIDSNTLLQLFDQYCKGEVTGEKCIEEFTNNTGLLKI